MAASLHVAAELNNLETIRRHVRETAADLKVDPDAISDALLAVTEMATNTIVHGYRGRPGSIEIEVGHEGDSLVIRLRDRSPPFDPTAVPLPDVTLPLDQRPHGGMGIYLTRQLMDEVLYRVTAGRGNELVLVKRGCVRNSPSPKGGHP